MSFLLKELFTVSSCVILLLKFSLFLVVIGRQNWLNCYYKYEPNLQVRSEYAGPKVTGKNGLSEG